MPPGFPSVENIARKCVWNVAQVRALCPGGPKEKGIVKRGSLPREDAKQRGKEVLVTRGSRGLSVVIPGTWELKWRVMSVSPTVLRPVGNIRKCVTPTQRVGPESFEPGRAQN